MRPLFWGNDVIVYVNRLRTTEARTEAQAATNPGRGFTQVGGRGKARRT
jgi:hypothetical protein